jgi:hypothetical protein
MTECPHCHGRLVGLKPAYDRDRDQRRLALGQCVDCANDKTDRELAAGHWRCFRCRQKRNNKMARKRGAMADVSMTSKRQSLAMRNR